MDSRSLKTIHAVCGVLFLLWGGVTLGGPSQKTRDLPPKYRTWLTEDVVYIITPKEKDVFLQLESDRDRDLFIEAFWRQRDPVAETRNNEFQEEHERRIQYANTQLGRGSHQPGWKTDRGKVYIILGKPASVSSYGGEQINLVPIEVWFYQGNYGPGMPASFYVVFFQEEGLGDYILYSPLRHGPKKLLEAYDGDPRQAVNRILRVDRELASVSLSLIPGQSTASTDTRPALDSEMLLNKLAVLPQQKVDDLYAERLLKYKSFIEVDHSVYYVGNEALLKVVPEGEDRYFVHYAVEPSRLSVGSAEGKYFIHLEVFGRVADLSGKTVYQYKKDVSLDLDPEQVQEMKTKRFSFQDAFPLISGRYRFDVLIKNQVSKEFTSFESEVAIPGPLAAPRLAPLILSARREKRAASDSGFLAFRVGDAQLYPVANRIFKKSDRLFVTFAVLGATPVLAEAGQLEFALFREDSKVLSFTKALRDYPGPQAYCEELDLSPHDPGLFSITVSLRDADNMDLGAAKEDFILSAQPGLPATWSISERNPPPDDPQYSHILGTELLSVDRIEEAKKILEDAYRKRPDSLDFALSLAQAHFRSQEYPKVEELLTRFLSQADEQSQVYDLLGRSHFHQGDFAKAVYYFKKYLSHFGTNLEILNLLAESFYQVGEKEEARSAWKKSLEIEPRQEEVRKKLEILEKSPARSHPSPKEVHQP
jgi:GWxTD domain-containing protein